MGLGGFKGLLGGGEGKPVLNLRTVGCGLGATGKPVKDFNGTYMVWCALCLGKIVLCKMKES